MKVKLTIDRGNTAIKCAAWNSDGTIVATRKGDESLPAADLVRLMAREVFGNPDEMFDSIAWCTVVASEHADDEASLQEIGVPHLVELKASMPLPVNIAYLTPATLGADRVAAALGAIEIAGDSRPLLVSDIGTAVTYDYVADRTFRGGNIAPGIDLRLRALAAFTDALPAVSVSGGDIPLWGRTTAEAMRSGAVRGIAAELAYYHAAAGEEALAVITGGSAEVLVNEHILTFEYIYDPYLVHRGLYSLIKDED
ncbi:MAG: type III pantothenate kinase [Muribaculaceae bacterium]|nr:type III pantothenate kinase [Muribaculaceae bacterium]